MFVSRIHVEKRQIPIRQFLLTLANLSRSHAGDHFSLCWVHTTAGRDQAGNRDIGIICPHFSNLHNFTDSLVRNTIQQLFI